MQDKSATLDARHAAVQLLRSVLHDHRQLSDVIPDLDGLKPADRARAQRLAVTVLRHLGRADAVIDRFVDRTPPMVAHNILRLAVVELLVEGEAPHGVVDSAVNLMRRNRASNRMAGLANAVLRKVAEDGAAIWDELPPPSLLKWLRRRIVHIYDEPTVLAIEAAHMAGAPLDITVKDGDWADKLGAAVLPTGSLRIARTVQVSDLPGYADGAWWVQDAAAAIPARMLGDITGARVLDLCAAPGGKTMQLAAMGAQVTALDAAPGRMKRVRENLDRTGLVADCVVANALDWRPETLFDAVLLDAPCSATGTIRRHPDLPYVKNGKDLDDIFALQSDLIDAAVACLKPGGKLVYCTCSLLTEEGERQAKLAQTRHDLHVIDVAPDTLGLDRTWARDGGGIRLRPDYWQDHGGMDGFFTILLQKGHGADSV